MQHIITYRIATSADIDTIIKYRLLMLNELHDPHTEEQAQTLIQYLEAYFSQSIKDGSYISWIAYINNEIAGIGGMTIWSKPGNYKLPAGKIGYILNIYTAPAHRGKGICTGIMQQLIENAKEIGISKLELHASPGGEVIYRRLGFNEHHNPYLELALP